MTYCRPSESLVGLLRKVKPLIKCSFRTGQRDRALEGRGIAFEEVSPQSQMSSFLHLPLWQNQSTDSKKEWLFSGWLSDPESVTGPVVGVDLNKHEVRKANSRKNELDVIIEYRLLDLIFKHI